jgi:hypothetical protein
MIAVENPSAAEPMRQTVFGRVLCELVEERGIPATVEHIAPLAEEADVHVRDLVDRMSSPQADYPGNLSGFVDALGLNREEMLRLALAFSFEEYRES